MANKNKKNSNKLKKTRKLSRVSEMFIALIIIFFSIIGVFELGVIGELLTATIRYIFGSFPHLFFSLILFFTIYWAIFRQPIKYTFQQKFGFYLLIVSFCTLLVVIKNPELKGIDLLADFFKSSGQIFAGNIDASGGIVGNIFYSFFSFLFDKIGALLLTVVLLLVSVLLLFYSKANEIQESLISRNQSFKFKKIDWSNWRKAKSINQPLEVETIEEFKPMTMETALKNQASNNSFAPINVNSNKKPVVIPKISQPEQKPDLKSEETPVVADKNEIVSAEKLLESYQFPPISILDKIAVNKNQSANSNSAAAKGSRLVSILQQFGINCTLVETHIGPAVTKFELKLDSGVKVSRISSLQDNLMMELAVKEIRIEAPIPGKNAIGVEIPNIEMTPVRLVELLTNVPNELKNEPLMVALGKNLMGKNIYGIINKMPHLLVAGATGSGKSVGVNSMICSILMHAKPSDVKLVLIDPKKVEFQIYQDIPHLLTPVINNPVEAAKALQIVVKIMDERYQKFMEKHAKNLATYNEMAKHDSSIEKIPQIVVIIDELADLMMVAGKEVESNIQRITQLARAAGIHLIVATQRPSVDVITGVIKANIPSRIAFAVSSATDSRTILDGPGADRLLGYGDMLYQPFGEPHPTRVQGVFISDAEVARIAQFAKDQGKPVYDMTFQADNHDEEKNSDSTGNTHEDPLYNEVREYVIDQQKASTSLLQRRFGIGYNRAARLIDFLEANGVIGPIQGAKPRDVYIKPEQPSSLDSEG